MITKDKLFIDGKWVPPAGNGVIEVASPATEQVIGRVPDGSTADMDRAVAAARSAFDNGPWPRTPPAERAQVLTKLSNALKARHQEIANLITEENGCPISFSVPGQALGSALAVDYFAQLAGEFSFEEERTGLMGKSHVRKEPVGVVAAIVPWNAPLMLAVLKLAPALVAGCTVVMKPSPETPLDAYILAECLEEAGLPEGVVNIVAAGREVGEHLVTHPGVDKVSFTGSTAAGRRIAGLCGERMQRVTLELGGKSAAIVCDDADLSVTIPGLLTYSTAFLSGQACAAQTRILAPRTRYDEIVDGLVEGARAHVIGDPLDEQTQVGPLIAERQRARVEEYIASGLAEGAKIATGGGRPSHLSRGWYVDPTVFTDVTNDMRIAQEEIFGPVIAVLPYDDADEAIAIANDSSYGLSGTVWSTDTDRAVEIAAKVRTGSLTVNGFMLEFNCPYGGFKCSGIGREGGPEGLEAYLEYKTIGIPSTDTALFSG